jgi:zinc transport system substrate-binding protein
MINLSKILILIIVFLSACRSTPDSAKEKIITVSILPQKTFVEKIAGSGYRINVLIPPGSSPAAYTLSPSQMADIAKSVVWFRIGHIGFEYSWGENIARVNSKMKVVDLSAGLTLIKRGTSESGGTDPHTWLSPACVKQMAAEIRDVLCDLYPSEAHTYKKNYLGFADEIDQLDSQIKKILNDQHGKKIITFHPTLSYFAREYGLQQISLEPGGKEPTPQSILEVMQTAKNEGIKVLYIQSELDREQARIFAEETGGQIIKVNPLDPAWGENLLSLAKTISENLK